MSREIKFRGKRLDNTEWVYGNLVKMHCVNGREAFTDGIQIEYREFHYASIEVDPETVGQFTGLKDKNGKEIYEGDIVNAEMNDIVRQKGKWVTKTKVEKFFVEWVQDDTGFRFRGIDNVNWTMKDTVMEVVGNIHENPELLVQE